MLLFWLGLMTAAWWFTVLGVGYVVWRYVYGPWKVMRADITALVARIVQLEQEKELRRVKVMGQTPEDEYRAEVRQRTHRLLQGDVV